MRFLIFASIFLSVMALLNFYVYRRFLNRLSSRLRKYSWLIPALLMLGETLYVLDIATRIIPDSPLLYMISGSFVGITFILFVVATFYDLVVTVSTQVPFNQERRRFVKIVFDVTMLVAAMSYLFRGLIEGAREPVLNTVEVKIDNFPFNDFNIIQLTDLHVGRTIRRPFVEHLVKRCNEEKPDMVVITGDLVDLPMEKIKHDIEPLKEISAPTYFILGNHEYFRGPQPVIDYIKTLGIKPLLNECVVIGEGKNRFNLVGINDRVGERMGMFPADFETAYENVDATLPTILLVHQPIMIERIGDRRADLTLCGHTHGGQIFPFGLLVMIDQPYIQGLYQHSHDKQVYVSRGTGYWGPPIRVLAPSEISKIVISQRV